MIKRLRIGFGLVFAIAALAVVPVMAQAAPHVYENGVKVAEGTKQPYIAWGTLTFNLTTWSATAGEVECHTASGGYRENPVGETFRTFGKVQAFASYECVDATCSSQGGKQVTFTAINLPWQSQIWEVGEPGHFQERIGWHTEDPPKAHWPEEVNFVYHCEGMSELEVYGAIPLSVLNNGHRIGATPSELELTGQFVERAFTPILGRLKNEGYTNEAILEVHNP